MGSTFPIPDCLPVSPSDAHAISAANAQDISEVLEELFDWIGVEEGKNKFDVNFVVAALFRRIASDLKFMSDNIDAVTQDLALYIANNMADINSHILQIDVGSAVEYLANGQTKPFSQSPLAIMPGEDSQNVENDTQKVAQETTQEASQITIADTGEATTTVSIPVQAGSVQTIKIELTIIVKQNGVAIPGNLEVSNEISELPKPHFSQPELVDVVVNPEQL